MKVVVGDEVYDGSKVPIMVVLSEQDKKLIRKMPKANRCYAQYPGHLSVENIRRWMKKTVGCGES